MAECGPPWGTTIKPRGFDIDDGEGGKRRIPSMGMPVVLSGGTIETICHDSPKGDNDVNDTYGAAAAAFMGVLVIAWWPKVGAQLAT